MFNLFKKKPTGLPAQAGSTITLKLSGLHCSSCSLNIDGELEELPGVISSSTSYAKQESTITYDPKLTTPAHFKPVIEKLGYQVISYGYVVRSQKQNYSHYWFN